MTDSKKMNKKSRIQATFILLLCLYLGSTSVPGRNGSLQ